MPLDGLTLHFLADELSKAVCGSRIEKIHQPSRDELIIGLRSREGADKLLVSASANCPRLHLTMRAPENPATPPMLCMLMRKHLTGAVITAVRQNELDRLLLIDLAGTNELGDKTTYTLCIEIMSKHSNIVLVNEQGLIVDAVKRIDFTQSSVRQILPGLKYTLPPSQSKLNILNCDINSAVEQVLSLKNKLLSQAVLETIQGVSPLISREIASCACSDDMPVADVSFTVRDKLTAKLLVMQKMLACGSAVPTVLIREGVKAFDFTFMDITQFGFAVEGRQKNSFSQLLDDFYYEKDRAERTRQRSSALQKLLSNNISRLSRKIEAQRAELAQCADRDSLRINAELILANQYRLGKGVPFYDVNNFYDNNATVRIPVDPALSPSANAQRYFKEYRKAKTAEGLLGGLIEQGISELAYLESVADSVNRAGGFTELAEIRAELYENGYLKRAKGDNGKKIKPMPALEYVSDDGFRILVGRNNLQNEMITFKTARKDDSWFHVQKMPGSHVVVIGEGKVIPERTARQAAILAAYHSGARDSSQVPVDYTLVRELKKPPAGKPGKVIYHEYNTMWVTPDSELCERLAQKR